MLSNYDLCLKQYTIEELEENVDYLELRTILAKQKITADFAIKYILNDEYHTSTEESYICDYDVLKSQKHLTKEDLALARQKFYGSNK